MQKSLFFLVLVLTVLCSPDSRASTGVADKTEMLRGLDFIRSIFNARYAPKEWKHKFANWDLDEQINKAKDQVDKAARLSLPEYHRIVKGFFNSTRDYHVGVRFYSTETSTLPFQLKGLGGKYYLVYIDREKLPTHTFPFQLGDELVSFDGKPTAVAMKELQKEVVAGDEATDRALTELAFTSRSGASALTTPDGPVTVTVKPRGSTKTQTRQIMWSHTKEQVTDSPEDEVPAKSLGQLFDHQMVMPDWDASTVDAVNPFSLGAKKSFIPALGKKIWESEATDSFDAYLFLTPEKKLTGYVRIASFSGAEKEAKAFGELLTRFEGVADSLVIDQVNNPGGSVFYLYSLASMLLDQSSPTPRHRMSITQSEVADAAKMIEKMRDVKNDADAKRVLGGDNEGGYPVDYEFSRFLLNYSEFILSQWHSGKRLTDPYHLYGVDFLNPSPIAKFTKPILLLINELDFSGGDFFPAILQDNKRVKTLGTRTAGAGGYVSPLTYPNILGIERATVTGSLAERVDRNPIENLGVKPDIEYVLTEKDLQGNFADYVKAIQKALGEITKLQ